MVRGREGRVKCWKLMRKRRGGKNIISSLGGRALHTTNEGKVGMEWKLYMERMGNIKWRMAERGG